MLTHRRDAYRRAALAEVAQVELDDVIGEAADGREAVALARALRPDVCLFDIRMPHVDGIEATRQLAGPDVEDPLAIVVITTFDLDEYVHGALKTGARGFLLKDAGPDLLTQAIYAAALGDALIAFISISTVKTHLASLMRKLDARNRVEMAMWAHETGRVRK